MMKTLQEVSVEVGALSSKVSELSSHHTPKRTAAPKASPPKAATRPAPAALSSQAAAPAVKKAAPAAPAAAAPRPAAGAVPA
eukprot:CAMPEP_0173449780 /NCGR_PEP_ID=MMETSP1357-20121228/43400_1 /TAXON_ID=77926 /ORGANISM="Hemiselmis rufescens, Strain PCC563" /LENGTH=81 /DNA_ID=CAMNT_0014416395 /DNA_START=44 /DNA_END=285 /DNA_ORIENTATION=+